MGENHLGQTFDSAMVSSVREYYCLFCFGMELRAYARRRTVTQVSPQKNVNKV